MHYDVLIVGGGLVGSSLAAALKNLSINVGLIEAIPSTKKLVDHYDARSISLSYASCQIFQSLGLWDKLEPFGVDIHKVHISAKGHFGATKIYAKEYQLPRLGAIVEILHINRILNEQLTSQENLDVFCPANLVALKEISSGYQLDIEKDGCVSTVTTDLLVAADGAHSIVRKLVGISAYEINYEQHAIVSNVSVSRQASNIAFERFTNTGPLALLPHRHDQYGSVLTVNSDEVEQFMQLSDTDYLNYLQSMLGYRAGKFLKIGKRQSFPLKLVAADRVIGSHVVVIGNAAHALHPIAGQGFNLGLRDAAWLAEIIVDAYHSQSMGSDNMLQAYQDRRQSDHYQMLKFTDGLAWIFLSPFFPLTIARSMVLQLCDLYSPVKNFFSRRALGLGGDQVPQMVCGDPL